MLFSIVLPTYNRAHLLSKAIESVLAQTYTNWELIIADDGSTDDTISVINRYQDPRITYVKRTNGGPGAARNTGLSHASGDYIAFLDSDDYLLPHHLTTFAQYLQKHNSPKGLFRAFIKWERDGQIIGDQELRKQSYPSSHIYVMHGAMYPTSCVIDHTVAQRHQFNEAIPISIDAEFWLRVLLDTPLYIIPEIVGVIRLHDQNLTIKKDNTYLRYIQVWEEIRTQDHLRPYLPLKYIDKFISQQYLNLSFNQISRKEASQARISMRRAVSYDLSLLWDKIWLKSWFKSYRLT